MKTDIIPQIKDIDVKQTPLRLADFHLDESVLRAFPNAGRIFEEKPPEGQFPIVFTASPLEDEEYRMIAKAERIEISAADSRGLMYGLFTLAELDVMNDGALCEFDAFDKPSLPLRGLSDDISRGQISTLEDFYAIIRKLARYKYNTYMPYMEDVFKFASIPAWGRYSDPIGKEEWQAIIAYAKGWNISVRPILNLLGHFDKSSNIADLQYLSLRNGDGSVSDCMDPKKPEVREIIKKMLVEIVDCFGPGVIHCGGDEPLALTEVYGKAEGGRLFVEHYNFIADELKKLDCTMMMYADFFAPPWGDYAVPMDRALEIRKGTEFVFWDYAVRPEYPFVNALHEHGLQLYISPGTQTWKRFSCDIKHCFENTKGLLKADNGRSKGMIMSSWGDGGDILRELAWPGILIGANFCWSPSSGYSYEEYYDLYHKTFFGFDRDEAALLEPVYHHDRIVKRKDEQEFKLETWVSPFEPVRFGDWENIGILQAAMRKAAVDLESLQPVRNGSAFDALKLTVARAAFTANKIAWLPHEKLVSLEQAAPYAERALMLAGELQVVKELHRKLWFANNRNSEWTMCEARYDDLYDELQMFARNVKLRKMFNIHI